MLRYEASVRELFYRSCTADRSFVPQDDRKIGYVMLRNEASIRQLFYRSCIVDRSFVPHDDKEIQYVTGRALRGGYWQFFNHILTQNEG
jgi:hypothetical protein